MAAILTIEGAHVFGSGLANYGVPTEAEQILAHIQQVKNWAYVPLFIGLAHNFNNDLCGHARSLQRLGKLVNQEQNLKNGISPLGYKVLQTVLDNTNGPRILIDTKHMSLAARLDYYRFLKNHFPAEKIPVIMSHGAVTGCALDGTKHHAPYLDIFNAHDINVFDEEIMEIAASGGLLAIQMDRTINAEVQKAKQLFKQCGFGTPLQQSAAIIWNQLQHIALVCDKKGLFGWGCTAIGSDFDGSISPFPGITTATGLEPLSKELIPLAHRFLSTKKLLLPQNHNITPEEVVERFFYTNIVSFLQKHYTRKPTLQQQYSYSS